MPSPLDRLTELLESLKSQIQRMEQHAHLPDLQGDLYNEVWVRLLSRFEAKGVPEGVTAEYIICTARNIIISCARRNRTVVCHPDLPHDVPVPEVEWPDRKASRNETRRAINHIVSKLPYEQRQLIWRKHDSPNKKSPPMSCRQRTRLHRTLAILRNDPGFQAFQ